MPTRDKILLVLGGVVVGLVCTEMVLAGFSPQPDFYFFQYAPGGYIFHKSNFDNIIAEVLNKNTKAKPPSNGIATTTLNINIIKQYLMPLHTNNAGFRNPELITYQKTSGQYRILHLGDSLGFGFPLPQAESYPTQVQNLVPDTEVLNASTVLTHTARLLQYYQKEGYKYDPDMVILQLTMSFSNEDYLWLDSFGKSQFELTMLKESGKYDAIQPMLTKDEAGIDQLPWTYSPQTAGLFDKLNQTLDPSGFLYHQLNTARLFYNAFNVLRTPTRLIVQKYVTPIGPITRSYQKIQVATTSKPMIAQNPVFVMTKLSETFGLKFTYKYLETFHTLLTEAHKQFIVIIIPNRYGCRGDTYAAWERLLVELSKNKYDVVNFYPDLCDATTKKPREEFYLPNEFHLNAAGNTLIAKRLAEEVEKLKNAEP